MRRIEHGPVHHQAQRRGRGGDERLVFSACAAALGTYPISSAAFRTRVIVLRLTSSAPLSALLTVETETPQRSAICLIVAVRAPFPVFRKGKTEWRKFS